MIKKLFLALFILGPLLSSAQEVSIIPQPVSLVRQQGQFVLDRHTSVQYDPSSAALKDAADLLSFYIKDISGLSLSRNVKAARSIELKIGKIPGIGNEGYLLQVTPTRLQVSANTSTGIVYGMQTLLQVLDPATAGQLSVPAMQVKDYPRFSYRGMHLDVGRHFFPLSFVKKYIDFMARYKFNNFHWHLTEDQGWRIEIRKYPKLMTRAAYRNGTIVGNYPGTHNNNLRYGGFYTQEEVKEVVAYASQRKINVIPEIEMPGHSSAAIAAYPWLSCFPDKPTTIPAHPSAYSTLLQKQGEKKLVQESWGVYEDIFCAGKDSTFIFLQHVLDEVLALFPSRYIHVGGDEAPKTHWKSCVACQSRIKAENLKDEHQLQSYFIQRMEKYLNSKGRILIGWDEILEGGLAPNAVVMSWRGEAGGIEAARQDHDVIMTPGTPVYFDHYQGDPASEPIAIGGFNTLKRVYDYEPVPKELDSLQAKHVLGAQANLWTEYVPTTQHVEYMVLPRMLALSEAVWSRKESKDWNSFNERLQPHFRYFEAKGWNYGKGNYRVDIRPSTLNGQVLVALSTEANKAAVYYTTDGTEPTLQSKKYHEPVRIDSSVSLKAVTVVNGSIMSSVAAKQKFEMHGAVGKEVSYSNAVSRSYRANGPNSLTDGIRGSENIHRFWHGFSGKDLVATIDLVDAKQVQNISLGCLQNYGDWIMMPQWVRYETSLDGKAFTEVKMVANDLSVDERATTIKDFSATFPARKARFVRVTAKVLEALPAGHPGAGKPAWIFADEIIVR